MHIATPKSACLARDVLSPETSSSSSYLETSTTQSLGLVPGLRLYFLGSVVMGQCPSST